MQKRTVFINGKKNDGLLLNCRGCAIILNDVLIAMGIPSKFIACMSNDPYDPECHVTNSVYIKEYDKWIMLDASIQTYIATNDGVPMSIFEVHDRLINGVRLNFMISPCIPNNNLVKCNFENYLIKNMFCFLSYKHYGPYCDNWNNKNHKYLLLPIENNSMYSKLNVEDSNITITHNPLTFFK